MKIEVGQRYKLNSDNFGTIVSTYIRKGVEYIVMAYKDEYYNDHNSMIYTKKEFEEMTKLFYDYDKDFKITELEV